MKSVVLLIDTSSNQEVTVGLGIDGKKEEITRELDKRKAQVVLPMIDEILQKKGLSPTDLTGIQVHTGPGSFTGVRVGVSIANTMGAYLKIPINNLPIGELAEPQYS